MYLALSGGTYMYMYQPDFERFVAKQCDVPIWSGRGEPVFGKHLDEERFIGTPFLWNGRGLQHIY